MSAGDQETGDGVGEAPDTLATDGITNDDIGEIRVKKINGFGMWRKRKGIAIIKLGDGKLEDGALLNAELHWYEASGLGKHEFKIKRLMARS